MYKFSFVPLCLSVLRGFRMTTGDDLSSYGLSIWNEHIVAIIQHDPIKSEAVITPNDSPQRPTK